MDKIIKSEEKFRKIYCEQNKIFNIIINWNWFITGVVVGLFSTFLGIFVQKGATLGYIGFGVGVLLDYFFVLGPNIDFMCSCDEYNVKH